jgi:hypothetical protein
MAEKLIGLRARASDPDWDALLETMYPRPEPD